MPIHRVVALALPGVVLLDLAAPTHLFGHCGGSWYDFRLAGVRSGPVGTSTGFAVTAPHGVRALATADTIVVPGIETVPAPDELTVTVRALRRAYARGARIMSICTGAFLLAEAGLLDGRRATTHWSAAAQLARAYPAVTLDPTVLYVDEGQILTSAGVAAGLDLCLHVIRKDCGAAVASEIARRTVLAPYRDGGQAQFVPGPRVPAVDDSLEPTRAWALGRLADTLDVPSLARHACMSPRTFARRFVQEAGTTPAQWVLEQRTRAAQALLEGSDLPVEQVAVRCGFGSAATLRAHFGRRLATTPTAYRRTFRTR